MFCGPCEPLFLCISEIEQHFETDHQGSFFSSSINWTIDMGFNGYIFISWNGGCLTPWWRGEGFEHIGVVRVPHVFWQNFHASTRRLPLIDLYSKISGNYTRLVASFVVVSIGSSLGGWEENVIFPCLWVNCCLELFFMSYEEYLSLTTRWRVGWEITRKEKGRKVIKLVYLV